MSPFAIVLIVVAVLGVFASFVFASFIFFRSRQGQREIDRVVEAARPAFLSVVPDAEPVVPDAEVEHAPAQYDPGAAPDSALARIAELEEQLATAEALCERHRQSLADRVRAEAHAETGPVCPEADEIVDALRRGGRLTIYALRGRSNGVAHAGPLGSGGVRATLTGVAHDDHRGPQDPVAALIASRHPLVRPSKNSDTGDGAVTTYVAVAEALLPEEAAPTARVLPEPEPVSEPDETDETDETGAALLSFIASDPGRTLAVIRRRVEAPDAEVKTALDELVDAGRVVVTNKGQRGPRKYAVPDTETT